ncbi:toxin-antitoxin system YwqK family antitoxin [Hymenobacter lucidus]|uniref:Toxin-antitoxin system YwqK family antitoxin n=1 Tax=Hymenobacter lucidus TaxID=2880930 RepID=A0ABS8AXN8_9BACT|nr:hypothetical protein [Hymenobacter lucidus]MCB2410570.1 hypothetical protein [Hymenobacter lucidus]
MRKHCYFVASLLVLLPASVRAQAGKQALPIDNAQEQVRQNRTRVTYFAGVGEEAFTRKAAIFRSQITMRDSVSGTERRYYPTGQLWMAIPYAHVPSKLRHGVLTIWYQSGQLMSREEYVGDKLQGGLKRYYADGTLQYEATYTQGKLDQEQCYTSTGAVISCLDYQLQELAAITSANARASGPASMAKPLTEPPPAYMPPNSHSKPDHILSPRGESSPILRVKP